jgi:DNA-binding response OmpR family regulator
MDKVRAFSVGGVDYITKPFQIEEVLARIEHQLTIKRLSKALKEKMNSYNKKFKNVAMRKLKLKRLIKLKANF